MTSPTAIALSKLIESPNLNQKQKVGVISRRPTENQSFARKKAQDILATDATILSKQNFREKTKSEIGGLQHQKSLQLFKGTVYQKMKFLSPKHDNQSKILNSSQQITNERSPRFSRKNHIELKKSISNTSLLKKETHKIEDNFRNSISQISLSSFVNKDEVLQTQPQTIDDLYDSTIQILELREQNVNLKRQIQVYKVKCSYLQQKLAKHESHLRKGTVFMNKCNFCSLLEVQIIKNARNTGILQIKIAEKNRQIQVLTRNLKSQKNHTVSIINKCSELQQQLTIIKSKSAQQQKSKLQLDLIISSLNQKLENTSDQIRYFNIQHNILLKKKHECEQSKAQSAKLITEKQVLRKQVEEYKQKLNVIRKIHSKKKSGKPKNKDIYYEDLFQLSSEHSTDGK